MPGHSRIDSESVRSGPMDGGIPREAAGSDAGDAAATPTRVSDWVAASGLSAEQDETLGALQVRQRSGDSALWAALQQRAQHGLPAACLQRCGHVWGVQHGLASGCQLHKANCSNTRRSSLASWQGVRLVQGLCVDSCSSPTCTLALERTLCS